MHKSVGKVKVVLRKVTPYFSVIQPLRISSKALTVSWMVGHFTCSK